MGFFSPAALDPDANEAKRRAALSSVLWSAFLTLLKIVAGLSTNSLGLLSEALHSALDVLAAGLTFLAVRLAAVPADSRHPYGHGKVENLSALAETGLLLATCVWIVYEAVKRLLFAASPVEPGWWAFAVIIISLLVDISRSAMLRRVARQHRSQALEADALHFTTDMVSSVVVLLGLSCAAAARWSEEGSFLHAALIRADAAAALGVAAIVVLVSWRLAGRAIMNLMDGGSESETLQVRAALAEMAPAYRVLRARVRESGSQYFVDLTVCAPAALRVDDAHTVSTILEDIVASVLPGAETAVHIEPDADGTRADMYATARHLATLRGLPIHSLALITRGDGLHVFVHIELPPDMPLVEAHARVSAYETDLEQRLGAVHVVSHIEPLSQPRPAYPARGTDDGSGAVLEILHELMARHPALSHCHDEEVWTLGNHSALSFRCCTDSGATVAEAHTYASRLEQELRRRVPSLGRVTIHVEPA
ncbi:MAG: cation diffusion facilitator family transporter [Desulfovibrionaceae bacterium]|nr:cation diffusion facilitator family transporter [Desulfovibrionaceae bacterium]